MSGSSPYGVALIGNGKNEDYACSGNILCGGSFAQCSVLNGTSFNLYEMVTASGCNSVSSATVQFQESFDGINWNIITSGSRQGGQGYAYIYWGVSTSSSYKRWRFVDSVYGASQVVHVNPPPQYNLTINVKDLLGNLITDSHVFIDEIGVGPGGTTVSKVAGTYTIKVTRDITCANQSFDTWASTQCSWTVNLTTNTTLDTTICMTNECREYNILLYNQGQFACSCDGTINGSQKWFHGNYMVFIGVIAVYQDEIPKRATLCFKKPWTDGDNDCDGISGSKRFDAYENTEYVFTNGVDVFKIVTGEIWNTGASRWIRIKRVCWPTRQNVGTVSEINKSAVYVDCANGNDNNSGLCGFANALKTITKAQTIVTNNGTVYIKYGNCNQEVLSSVLNPIQNIVKISPRLNDGTEGTGSVVIDGT